jgi:hypothetical protein
MAVSASEIAHIVVQHAFSDDQVRGEDNTIGVELVDPDSNNNPWFFFILIGLCPLKMISL